MTATELEWTSYARHLADLLRERGDIRSPQWHAAVAEVPRHVFVPRAYVQDTTGQWIAWDTAEHWDAVYAPETLVTALEDRGGYQEPVSSSTKPDLMVRMLEILDIQATHRVLEIGTGTGYNSALMCHRLGDERVYSVDVDPELVTLAEQRLASVGYRPTLAAVDGEGGLPEHAPYDRIIATCSVPAVPSAWADQLAPAGSILVDVRPAISAGNLVHLRRHDHGVLEGRFVARQASFMEMRHHDREHVAVSLPSEAEGERTRHTDAPVPPWREPVVWFLAQLAGLPRGLAQGMHLDPETREPTAATLASPDGSWARVGIGDRIVTEAGMTSLWEPVERAHQWWRESGRPGWDQLGLTVDRDGRHRVWRGEPSHAVEL